MNADAAAYALLGLKPGADRKAIEAAYKQLIKQHHPDRDGGDSARAAEINRAYHYLRKQPPAVMQPKPRPKPAATPVPPRKRRRWMPLLIIGSALTALVFTVAAIRDELRGLPLPFAMPVRAALEPPTLAQARASSIDAPLDSDGIERAVHSAVQLMGNGDTDRLAAQSRRCHAAFRRDPDAARLDRCVAFDEAVVALMQRDLLDDAGPFSASAVMARQITAARLLSDDSLAIDSRLGEIRSRVELVLAPVQQPPPQAATL